MASSSNVRRQQEMDQKGFKVTNDSHGTIYCNFMLLFAVTSTLEGDALAMRLDF